MHTTLDYCLAQNSFLLSPKYENLDRQIGSKWMGHKMVLSHTQAEGYKILTLNVFS